MSALDMQLHFISQYAGRELAVKVAEQFIYEHARKSQHQPGQRIQIRFA